MAPISSVLAVSSYNQAYALLNNINPSQLGSQMNTINQRFSQATPQQQQLGTSTRNIIQMSNPPNQSTDPLAFMKRDVAILIATSNYVFGIPALTQSTTTSGNPALTQSTTTSGNPAMNPSGSPAINPTSPTTLLPQALTKALTMSPTAIQSETQDGTTRYNSATPSKKTQFDNVKNEIATYIAAAQNKVAQNIVFGIPI
jgi:hypothetical protein